MNERRNSIWLFGIILVLSLLIQNVLADEVIYSDDFSTDPAGNWSSVVDDAGGQSPSIVWSSGSGNIALTDPDGNGYITMWTNAATSADASQGYHVEFDFMSAVGGTPLSVGVRVQRQGDNSHYRIRGYRGGSNDVLWRSDGPGLTDVSTIAPGYNGLVSSGQWYTLHAEVLDTGSQIEVKAVIYEQGTTNVAVPWSVTATDPGRNLTTNNGFGFQIGAAAAGEALYVDNFVVTEITPPSPYCGDSSTVYLAADLTGPEGVPDCHVDMYDFKLFAEDWLRCTDPTDSANCEQYYDYSKWLNNDLGKEETVPVPWTPVQVVGGDTVEIWGRSYVFNGIGLPSSLMAVGSDLLNGAMRFVTIVDGSPTAFTPTGPLTITPGDTKTIVEGNSTAGSLELQVVTTVEFDGFARVDLILTDTSGSVTLNKFWLEVPIVEDNALFYMPTFIDDHDPAMPAGGIKAPIVGVSDWGQRNSSKLYWVGGDDRGFFLAAEDDRNWKSANRNEAQELVPLAGEVIWRYHFVDESVDRDMSTPLELTYCFMATPVKPVDNWYKYRNSSDGGTWLLGGSNLQNAYDHGVRQVHYHEHWTEIMGYPGTFDPVRISGLHALMDEFKALGMNFVQRQL